MVAPRRQITNLAAGSYSNTAATAAATHLDLTASVTLNANVTVGSILSTGANIGNEGNSTCPISARTTSRGRFSTSAAAAPCPSSSSLNRLARYCCSWACCRCAGPVGGLAPRQPFERVAILRGKNCLPPQGMPVTSRPFCQAMLVRPKGSTRSPFDRISPCG
jgi:hypothetical protein